MTLPTGTLTFLYTDDGERAQQITVSSQQGILDRLYRFEKAGNMIEVDDGVLTEDSQLLSYDESNRLIEANGGYGEIDYEYDAVGKEIGRYL